MWLGGGGVIGIREFRLWHMGVFEEEAGPSLRCQLDIQVEMLSRQLDKNSIRSLREGKLDEWGSGVGGLGLLGRAIYELKGDRLSKVANRPHDLSG